MTTSLTQTDRFRGCLLGLAAGDAVGTTVEFKARNSFEPVTDMIGGGPFHLEAGQWTDDTSMALCLATSLVEIGGFDARDQMERYVRWWKEGYLSSTGECFDIGGTVSDALHRFATTGEPFSGSTHPRTAGNGCIMRLAPVVLFYYPDRERIVEYAAKSSRTTHGTAACLDACRLLGSILFRALAGARKEAVLFGTSSGLVSHEPIVEIAAGGYRQKTEAEIVGSGYVVKSLEAALWCFHTTGSFETAILKATNLGADADTTAAICGQVAGAFYGESGIPRSWRERLAMSAFIRDLADQLGDR